MVADPVFQKMQRMYGELSIFDNKPFTPGGKLRLSLSELATKMAERRMTESEYNSILNEDNPIFIDSSSLKENSLVKQD